jgi:hypothetical protein
MSKSIAIQGSPDDIFVERIREELELRGYEVATIYESTEDTHTRYYGSDKAEVFDRLAALTEVVEYLNPYAVNLFVDVFEGMPHMWWTNPKLVEVVEMAIDAAMLRVDHILFIQTQPDRTTEKGCETSRDMDIKTHEKLLNKICPKKNWHTLNSMNMNEIELFEQAFITIERWLK